MDHGGWAEILGACLKGNAGDITRFDYDAAGATHRRQLASYLASLGATAVSQLARPEQKAFWINLYNAQIVQLVVDHYPVRSVRDISVGSGRPGDGPWGAKLAIVEGEPLSLDDIVHRILRPIWRDPRILYGLCYAALGSPTCSERRSPA